MSGEPTIVADAVDRTRSLLLTLVTRFAAAWDATGAPPDLTEFLPGAPELRRLCLTELIKVDLEYRWLRYDHPKRLADYLTEFAELREGSIPLDLAYEEFHALRRSGREPESDENPEATEPAGERTEVDYHSTLIASPWAHEALENIEVGDRVDDFDLLVGLGSGSFARVFLARQRSLQRLVAVKISHNRGTEPETLAQLDHNYIVRVFDQRLIEDDELKLMYMEYVPGGTLLDVLNLVRERSPDRRTGRLLLEAVDQAMVSKGATGGGESGVRAEIAACTWPETVAWLGSRLAAALDHAARHGVLHRDIKPANVLLTAEGIPKLADFNISFSHHIAGTSPLAYFGGSLAYMSPEQLAACHPDLPASAADLDGRSDIYALGVMLWELLTGRRPFDDEAAAGGSDTSLERMLELRRREIDPRYLSELPQDCPPTLRRVLLKCLAPHRDERWSTGAELAQQFELCLDRRARDLVDPPSGSLRARLGPWSLLAIVTLASVLGGGLGVLYSNLHNGPLIQSWLTTDQRQRMREISAMLELTVPATVAIVTGYLCRRVFLVWWGLRRGRHYGAQTLARTRTDTLLDGDRVAMLAFAGWVVSAAAFVVGLLVHTDLAPGRIVHFVASLVVCATIAVAYPFFLVTFFVVRCVYPSLLARGATSSDHADLRALGRRCTRYLAVAASVPLIGVVTGLMFLTPQEVSLVVDPIRWLCVGGVLGFVGNYWLFRRLEEDLRAFERAVSAAHRR
ncbi:serine/threonine protein kinase [Nocardia sp. CDC159]|uniref:non-specific serine/threonine protein kinase n=1 Tax=Nocardia pulmonis TaxID=2951408 RepID=A0A9X2IVP9_9NOCA|nr:MULTISPECIES: serine/threonine-protein kinase [Nocardia]MCM6773453.1 serine/threonine protein kinase [Nocardia pulmonis]MCM6786340.1 serine/threonine protein kinase [Nocardia sp. CDC159]